MTSEYDRIAELEAELEEELEQMTTRAEFALSAHDDLERVLEHEEESNHISIEQWGIWEERAKQAEAALAERDYFIDSLHSESGIPTRHWRDTITRCVTDLRARSADDSQK